MVYNFYFENIDCANCAARIEREINKLAAVKEAHIDFMSTKVKVETVDNIEEAELLEQLNEVSDKVEAGSSINKTKSSRVDSNDTSCELDDSCECDHKHKQSQKNTHNHEEKSFIIPRIIVTAVLLLASFFVKQELLRIVMLVAAYVIISYDILILAVRNILKGQIFDENFLMAVASLGAMLIGLIPGANGEYAEGVAVMLFYQVGEYFQNKAVSQSRRSIAELMDIRPDYANLVIENGSKVVNPESVNIGDLILVKAGEKIPLDGIVVSGSSSLDVSALTGESMLKDVSIDNEVMSGSINKSGTLTIKVSRSFEQSTVSKILELVENASSNKSQSEKFITRFARYYTPVVVAIAVVIALIVPLILDGGLSYDYLHRALVFLVISCPCALVISVPLSFYGGIGGASKAGILFKGSNYVEALSTVNTVVFDKTGTLTKGNFSVTDIITKKDQDEVLEAAAYAEYHSTHPIGKSIVEAYKGKVDTKRINDASELEHLGMKVNVDGKQILAGNKKLMEMEGIRIPDIETPLTKIYVARDGEYLGALIISDEIKDDARAAIADLKNVGISHQVMLTGDTKEIAQLVARELGLSEVHTEMYPQDKVDEVSRLIAEGRKVAFVGDGINDAPVLTLADVGIAMGGVGSDAAIEAADVILMDDQPSKLAKAIRIAKKTMGIAKQNIVFALGIKLVVLILGALGIANMWMAVFADVGVSLLAILNAMRGLKVQ